MRTNQKGKEFTMYVERNFKTKKEFKEAVSRGARLTLFAPGLGSPRVDGIEWVEGPHFPQPHKWYAEVEMKNGFVVSVK